MHSSPEPVMNGLLLLLIIELEADYFCDMLHGLCVCVCVHLSRCLVCIGQTESGLMQVFMYSRCEGDSKNTQVKMWFLEHL